MSTTSSSRADRTALALTLLLLAACAATAPVAPEAPRQGPRLQPDRPVPPSGSDERLEVESATIRRASEAPELARRIGRAADPAADLLLIDVRTVQPLGDLGRAAAPVILLDGRPLHDTWPLDLHRLVAPIAASELGRGEHTIAVTRLGAEATTTSRREYVIRVP